jgi:hypothetical protein
MEETMPVGSAVLRIFGVASIITLALGCGGTSPYPPDVSETLKAAGDNRGQLEQVIRHYTETGDTLKLEAAYYLIGNMGDHCYATFALEDTSGNEIEFNALDYPDYATLTASFDSLEQRHGTLDFERKNKIMDAETITADFLITQIDYAFRAWNERPWAKGLTFDDFCAYVLPYRGSNEPLEPWRQTFFDKYANIMDSMHDPSDPVYAAVIINNDIKTWFGFDPRYYYHPTDQGMAEMMSAGLGRCEDMTNVTIYAMRANGLAVTSDYTPYWANSGNNHAWNAILSADGRVVPFMGAESNPGEYRLAYKPAKVYRKMFADQPDNLIFQDRKQEKVPAWLAGRSYIDVTADYQDVCDVTVTLADVPDSVDIAYLCVFNSGEWKPIHWARIEGNAATFTDMGRDIAYIPALYINKEVLPVGEPFILKTDCGQRVLSADTARVGRVSLTSTTRRKQEASTDGVSRSSLTKGHTYELFYMTDEWISAGKAVAGDGPLEFGNVPSGGLYWLVADGSDKEERVFTIEDGRQVWW